MNLVEGWSQWRILQAWLLQKTPWTNLNSTRLDYLGEQTSANNAPRRLARMSSLFPPPGPQLPPFKTLLVKGKYHSSAPIHLSLSHIARSNDFEVIIITPSRQKIATALQEYNDDWLTANSGLGAITCISSRVKLLSVAFNNAQCDIS
jgi:hypothetical protein